MEKNKSLCSVVVLILNLNSLCCQYAQSPCPDIFDYDYGPDIYGTIVIKPNQPVSELVLRINLTVATQLMTNYVGRIEAFDGDFAIHKYNQGSPVQYRVHFPVTSPLPKLTALTVNGELLCYGPGDVPRPNQYLTTLSMQHTSFLNRGGGNSFHPQKQNTPDPSYLDLLGHFDDDAKVLTFTNNIDSSHNWNNVPPTRQTQPVYHPSRPAYEHNATVSPRPSKPSRPVFDNEDRYEQFYDLHQTKRPIYDSDENRPVFQHTQLPVYEEPTRSTRPVEEIQRPMVTQRPPSTSINDECGIIAGGNEKLPLIYNGNSYSRGDIPWLVAIYRNRGGALSFICGGTLITDRHVVSAAHCMKLRSELTSVKDIVVKVGVHNLNDWGDDITVTRNLVSASIHESYNSTTLENDILVFTMSKPVQFNTYIRPACLWSGNTDLSRIVGTSGIVAGWGDQGFNDGKPGEPQMVRMPIVSTAMCRASKSDFHQITFRSTFCAGDRNGAGPCRGDSGGGLYILDNGKWRLRGVVSIALRPSNGQTTCDLNQYIVFTDTAQYLTWIRQITSQRYYD